MLLAILPDEARTDLGEAGYPGLTAVWRPMSLIDKAAWFDACAGIIETADAKVRAVRAQLLRIEGLEVQPADGGPGVPFDPSNPAHFAALPMGVINGIYMPILLRTSLGEKAAKN